MQDIYLDKRGECVVDNVVGQLSPNLTEGFHGLVPNDSLLNSGQVL